jgi:AmmeMemoRadiSam system protein B/AmmeMemoRadiSam system protein A
MTQGVQEIRKPTAAGLFYPASPVELSKSIATLFTEAKKPALAGRPIGLVAPHAGYMYSGRTAAFAYKVLDGEQYDSVVVISPSHTVFFKGSAVYDGDGYKTPLGVVEIDKELSARIASIHPSVYLSRQGHAGGSDRGEHALEVQLPFLQIALGGFKLVAIVMGDQEEDSVRSLAETLATSLTGKNALIVASSDLSHYHSDVEARRMDSFVQKAVGSFDPAATLNAISSGKSEACGAGPMAAMMMACKRLGAEDSELLHYSTSGETTGELDEVVGYMSAAITVSKIKADARGVAAHGVATRGMIGMPKAERPRDPAGPLSEYQKNQLKLIAQGAIKARLAGLSYDPPDVEGLSEKKGIFVTLEIGGNLRGCIGQIKAKQPLPELTAEMAVAAAFDDPRFPELSKEESEQIDISLSILSPLKRVHDFYKVEVGKHGLMIKLDMNSGLLLPQVATDNNWDREAFLEQTCLKAGLPRHSYKDQRAEVYSFTAEVF